MRTKQQHWACDACSWFGTEPTVLREENPENFWGRPVTRVTYEDLCPNCGEPVEPSSVCADCGDHPAEIGDDYCAACRLAEDEADFNFASLSARAHARLEADFLDTLVAISRSAA
jgi:hypothetical protein